MGLFQGGRRTRRAIAVDETKVRAQGQWLYVWAAINVETREARVARASRGRSGFEALRFLRVVLK